MLIAKTGQINPMCLQWVHGSRTVVMPSFSNARRTALQSSMGPRFSNRGYDRSENSTLRNNSLFNGSTVLEPWLWRVGQGVRQFGFESSMGPRFSNRGYGFPGGAAGVPQRFFNGSTVLEPWLCLFRDARHMENGAVLQWVHGSRTVVMFAARFANPRTSRFFNGSTVLEPWLCLASVPPAPPATKSSMGPRFSNRGYGYLRGGGPFATPALQWVHGSRTVVMQAFRVPEALQPIVFNGSTVLEPWLCSDRSRPRHRAGHIFNGSMVLEPWLWFSHARPLTQLSCNFNGSTVLEPWLCLHRAESALAKPRSSMGPRFSNRGYGLPPAANLHSVKETSMGPRFSNRGYG